LFGASPSGRRGCARVYSVLTDLGANFYVGFNAVDVSQWAAQVAHFSPPGLTFPDAGELQSEGNAAACPGQAQL